MEGALVSQLTELSFLMETTPDETHEEHHFLTLRSPVSTMKSVLHISFLPHFLLAEEATAPNSSSIRIS